MALRAFGRSRVRTATPFGNNFPLTKSSAAALAMAVNFLRERKRSDILRSTLGKIEVNDDDDDDDLIRS